MGRPRARVLLSLRGLMLLVLAVALVLEASRLWHFSTLYRQRAEECRRNERLWRYYGGLASWGKLYVDPEHVGGWRGDPSVPFLNHARGWNRGPLGKEPIPPEIAKVIPPTVAVCNQLIDYHTRLRQKYERLAWRPWLSATPDPPAPEAEVTSNWDDSY